MSSSEDQPPRLPGGTTPWWVVSLMAAAASMAVAVGLLFVPIRWLWLPGIGLATFLVMLRRNPAAWFRRIAEASMGAASAFFLTPTISGFISFNSDSFAAFVIDGGGPVGVVLCLVTIAFGYLDVASRRVSGPIDQHQTGVHGVIYAEKVEIHQHAAASLQQPATAHQDVNPAPQEPSMNSSQQPVTLKIGFEVEFQENTDGTRLFRFSVSHNSSDRLEKVRVSCEQVQDQTGQINPRLGELPLLKKGDAGKQTPPTEHSLDADKPTSFDLIQECLSRERFDLCHANGWSSERPGDCHKMRLPDSRMPAGVYYITVQVTAPSAHAASARFRVWKNQQGLQVDRLFGSVKEFRELLQNLDPQSQVAFHIDHAFHDINAELLELKETGVGVGFVMTSIEDAQRNLKWLKESVSAVMADRHRAKAAGIACALLAETFEEGDELQKLVILFLNGLLANRQMAPGAQVDSEIANRVYEASLRSGPEVTSTLLKSVGIEPDLD